MEKKYAFDCSVTFYYIDSLRNHPQYTQLIDKCNEPFQWVADKFDVSFRYADGFQEADEFLHAVKRHTGRIDLHEEVSRFDSVRHLLSIFEGIAGLAQVVPFVSDVQFRSCCK